MAMISKRVILHVGLVNIDVQYYFQCPSILHLPENLSNSLIIRVDNESYYIK